MFRWIPYTFVRILVVFVGGILLGIYFPDIISETQALWCVAGLVFAYVLIYWIRILRSFVPPSAVAFVALFVLGYAIVHLRNESRDPLHISKVSTQIEGYSVIVNSYPEEKAKFWKVVATVNAVYDHRWRNAKGSILLYFSKEDFNQPPAYGTRLVLNGAPQLIPGPGNPGEFDYRKYLAYQNVFHQAFLREEQVRFAGEEIPNRLIKYSIDVRNWAEEKIMTLVPGKQGQAITSALVLGITDGIDHDVLSAYSATGTMHVLAVSGLHISIIYLIIITLLKPLDKNRVGKKLVAIIALFLLWSYAFVTGMSPSVLRAVTMFSFVIVANAISRETNIYNTLASSAFCLLLFDPFLIMSVGFQLSYMAVIGIVYLHPILFQKFDPSNWLTTQIWTMVSVSIAAQVATFALGLLYFRQFPNYFLLSNIIVIPLANAILVVGLAAIALSSVFEPLASLIGVVISWMVKLMNGGVALIEKLPFSLITDIYITTEQCFLLIAIIVAFILALQYRQRSYFITFAVMVVIFAGARWWDYSRNTSPVFAVYKVPGYSASDLMAEGRSVSVCDSLLMEQQQKIKFHIQANRLIHYASHTESLPQAISKNLGRNIYVTWKGKSFLFLHENNDMIPQKVDYLIISRGVGSGFSLKDWKVSEQVIIDSSISLKDANAIMAQAEQQNINIHSVPHQGSFEVVLNPHEIHSI